MDDFKCLVEKVKETAREDRAKFKKMGNENAAVYFQGKIAACNELLEWMK